MKITGIANLFKTSAEDKDRARVDAFLAKAGPFIDGIVTEKAAEVGVPKPDVRFCQHRNFFYAEAYAQGGNEPLGRTPVCTMHAATPFKNARDTIRDNVVDLMMADYINNVTMNRSLDTFETGDMEK